MKKLIVAITLLFSCSAFAQTSQQTMSRIRDATNPALVAAVGAANGTVFATTIIGLTTRSMNYFYSGRDWNPMVPPWLKLDDDDITNEVEIKVGGADYTLPGSAGDWYCMTASSNSACIVCGVAPVAVMNTQCTIKLLESATRCRRLTGPVCNVIGPSTAGYVHFEHFNPAL